MRIDYCPKCNKSGLKHERYFSSPYANPPQIPTDEQRDENTAHRKLYEKWCHRCREWVNPYNKPYIGRTK